MIYQLEWLYEKINAGAVTYYGAMTFKEKVFVNIGYVEEKSEPFLYSVELVFTRNFKTLPYKPIEIRVMGKRGECETFTYITQSKQKDIYQKLTRIPQIKELLAWEYTNARKQLKEFEKEDWFGIDAFLEIELKRERNRYAEAAYQQKKALERNEWLQANPDKRPKDTKMKKKRLFAFLQSGELPNW